MIPENLRKCPWHEAEEGVAQQRLLKDPAKGMRGAHYSGSETGRSQCHGDVLG